MVPVRFVLSAVALVALTLHGQDSRTLAITEPTVSGVVKDVGGVPVSDVEVGIIRGKGCSSSSSPPTTGSSC